MFLAADEKGRILGRIQIIVNENEIRHFDTKMARFNKFDFVDDHRVSRALIRAAEKWLRDQKTEKIIGPFGYSNLDPKGPMIFSVFRSEEHTSELQSRGHLVCRLLLEKKKKS